MRWLEVTRISVACFILFALLKPLFWNTCPRQEPCEKCPRPQLCSAEADRLRALEAAIDKFHPELLASAAMIAAIAYLVKVGIDVITMVVKMLSVKSDLEYQLQMLAQNPPPVGFVFPQPAAAARAHRAMDDGN